MLSRIHTGGQWPSGLARAHAPASLPADFSEESRLHAAGGLVFTTLTANFLVTGAASGALRGQEIARPCRYYGRGHT